MVQKNAPTLADYNYDPVQSILIIFSKLFVNDHKSCLVVKFSTSPHICCHYTLWNTMLYFALITLLIDKNAPTSYHHNFNKCWRILIMFAVQYGHILRINCSVVVILSAFRAYDPPKKGGGNLPPEASISSPPLPPFPVPSFPLPSPPLPPLRSRSP